MAFIARIKSRFFSGGGEDRIGLKHVFVLLLEKESIISDTWGVEITIIL